MYDARTSKYIGGDDEISFGICLSDVVRDVAAHDGMGNLAESGLVICVCNSLVACICCRVAGSLFDRSGVGTCGAAIDSKNHPEMVRTSNAITLS